MAWHAHVGVIMTMFEASYVAGALITAVVITFTLRAAPFAIKNLIRHSSLLRQLNIWMPLGITTILAIYALTRVDLHQPVQLVSHGAGALVTAAVHYWRRSIFLSLVSGTLTCVILANGFLA